MKIERVLERLGPTHEEVVINKSTFNCGRTKDGDLVCPSKLVSRRHCVFHNRPEGLYVIDCGNSNGIFINGKQQKEGKHILLKDNDVIGIGCSEVASYNLDITMFVYKVKSRVVVSNDCECSAMNYREEIEVTNNNQNNKERAIRKEQSRMRNFNKNSVSMNKILKTAENHQEQQVPEIFDIIDDDDHDDIIEVNVIHSSTKISYKSKSSEDIEIMEVDIAPLAFTHNSVENDHELAEVKKTPKFCFSQIDLIEIDDEDECFPSSQLFEKTSNKEEQEEDCLETEIFLDEDDDENIVTIMDSDDENLFEINKDIYSHMRMKQEYQELNDFENKIEMHVSYINTNNTENVSKFESDGPILPLSEEPSLDPLALEYIKETLTDTLFPENVLKTLSDPLEAENVDETLTDLLETENVDKTLVDPLAAENLDKTLVDPLAAENLDKTLVDPLAAENDDETLVDPLAAENLDKTLVDPLAAENDDETLADQLVEHVNGKILNETTTKIGKDKERKKEITKIKNKKKKSSNKKSSKSEGSHSSDSNSSSSPHKNKIEELLFNSKNLSKDKNGSSTNKDTKHEDGKDHTSPDHSEENDITNEKEKATSSSVIEKPKNKLTNVKVKVSLKSRADLLCDSMQTLGTIPRKSIKKTTEEPKTVKMTEIRSTVVIPRRQVPLSSTFFSPSSTYRSNSFSSTNGLLSSTSFDKVASTVTRSSEVTSIVTDNRSASLTPTVIPTIVDHRESSNHSDNDDRIPSPLLAVEPVINPLATSAIKSLNSSTASKKKVSFKENIASIREYPIESGNQMRNIREGLNLRASRRDGIHRPLDMKLEDFLARIFAWEPVWLEQQQKVKDLPPIVMKEEMQQLPDSFVSFEEYYKRMEVLLLLETWQLLYKEYECAGTRYKQSKALHCTFVRHSVRQMQTPNGLRYSMLAINTLVTNEDLKLQNHPVFGDMIILEYFAKHDGVQKFRRAFAYVIEVQQQNSLRFLRTNSDSQLIKYCPRPDALMTYIVQTRIIDEHTVQFEKLARLRSILYLRSHLRLIQGLQFVPHSALQDLILNVNIDEFELEPITKEHIVKYNLVTQEKLNEKQMEAVIKFTNASIKLEPKISLLVGPPGTGKSKVIANLVTQILYGEGRYVNKQHIRILVCAPSNAAIDEIVLRLLGIRAAITDYKFRIVRIGRMESMHKEVKKISVPELAKEEIERIYSEQQNSEYMEQKRNRLRKEIDTLELLLANNPHNLVYRSNLADLKTKFFKLANKNPEKEDAGLSNLQSAAKIKIIKRADVIACTLSSCYTNQMQSIFGNGKNSEKIGTCIVDEATQSCEAETLIPLLLGVKNLILVGDPNQLPATVMSTDAKKLGLDRSLFTRTKSALETQYNESNAEQKDPVIMLNVQYRMVNAISHWPNKYFYGGKLIDRVNYKLSFPLQPYRVLNLDGMQDDIKFSNTSEALFVGNLINCLMTYSKLSSWNSKITIGVITPYQNQKSVIMNTIRQQTKHVPEYIRNKFVTEVNTIDSFQGQERDVIIMSCVRSRGIGFLSDQQRLCVALTRAKFSLIICGNFNTFQRDSMWKDLLTDARSRGVVARLNTKANPIDIKPHVIRLDL